MSTITIYVPRTMGGTLILTVPAPIPGPTLEITAVFRDGNDTAVFRDGVSALATFRDGAIAAAVYRDGITPVATFRDGKTQADGR